MSRVPPILASEPWPAAPAVRKGRPLVSCL